MYLELSVFYLLMLFNLVYNSSFHPFTWKSSQTADTTSAVQLILENLWHKKKKKTE